MTNILDFFVNNNICKSCCYFIPNTSFQLNIKKFILILHILLKEESSLKIIGLHKRKLDKFSFEKTCIMTSFWYAITVFNYAHIIAHHCWILPAQIALVHYTHIKWWHFLERPLIWHSRLEEVFPCGLRSLKGTYALSHCRLIQNNTQWCLIPIWWLKSALLIMLFYQKVPRVSFLG